jgi:hypothetical protein
VDGADYVLWQATDGTVASYLLWRSNFGKLASSAAGQAITEHPTLLLALLAIVASGMCRLVKEREYE